MSMEALGEAGRGLVEGGGRFEGGRYFAGKKKEEGGGESESDGKKEEDEGIDGYQACWEWYNKKPLVYPQPRYNAPIIIDPRAMRWQNFQGSILSPSVKHLGTFSERGTKVEMVNVGRMGFASIGKDDAMHLVYVLDGEGTVRVKEQKKVEEGRWQVRTKEEHKLLVESCVFLMPRESCCVTSEERLVFLHFRMPMFYDTDLMCQWWEKVKEKDGEGYVPL